MAEAATTTTTYTTYTDVITKFTELNNLYYSTRGCMISTLNDEFSKKFLEKHPDLIWEQKYNQYAEANVLTAKINITIFGRPFVVMLCRPIKEVHRYEYEEFFGFLGHCKGFSRDRIIMTFAESFDKNIDIEYLLMTGTLVGNSEAEAEGEGDGEKYCVIDESYIKNALKLLVVGGYVKYWAAFNKFKNWFKERGFDYEITTDDTDTALNMASFVFEDYHVADKDEDDMVKES
jgi:hypothetical protein